MKEYQLPMIQIFIEHWKQFNETVMWIAEMEIFVQFIFLSRLITSKCIGV